MNRLLEMTVAQLIKKFPLIYGTQMFIRTFTIAYQLVTVLSHINPVHALQTYFFKIQFNIIPPI